MPQNVEIKARLRDPDGTAAQAAQLAGTPAVVLHQKDTFFHAAHGRLKLREMSGPNRPAEAQLIWYERPDESGPKVSNYQLVPAPDPAALEAALTAAMGRRAVVRKTRHLHLLGQTRVHLDHVEGLGHYLELEVVLHPDQPPEEGRAIADELMKKLGVEPADLVVGAYVDLMS